MTVSDDHPQKQGEALRFNENGQITKPEASLQRRRIHALIEQVAGSANTHLDLGADDILDLTRGD